MSATARGDRDTSVLLQLELNGLSSVGVGADAFLERSIRGYSFSPPETSRKPMKSLNLTSVCRAPRPRRSCLCIAFGAGVASAQTRELSGSGELLDRIAAVVNDGVVLMSQLDAQTEEVIQRLRQQKTELPPRNVLRKQILERLVVEEIQVQRAERLGIQVSDEMLNGALG